MFFNGHLVNTPAKLYSVLTIGFRDVKSSYRGILGNPGKQIYLSYFVSHPVTISVKLFDSDNSLQDMFKVSSLCRGNNLRHSVGVVNT